MSKEGSVGNVFRLKEQHPKPTLVDAVALHEIMKDDKFREELEMVLSVEKTLMTPEEVSSECVVQIEHYQQAIAERLTTKETTPAGSYENRRAQSGEILATNLLSLWTAYHEELKNQMACEDMLPTWEKFESKRKEILAIANALTVRAKPREPLLLVGNN